MTEFLPASLAALGAVIGFIFGAVLGGIVGSVVSNTDLADAISITIGGLGFALAYAWLGLRLSARFANRNAKPS